MDEIWERAVETALGGQTKPETTRRLTLDGAVKCVKGHLPRPEIFERYENLEHLSIASVGVSSLDRFPRLGKLQKLVLSDNRISGGLEFLVQAGLGSLRDLDLSNNRIQLIDDLLPLAQLKLVSLDLYKCPVTLVEGYRSRVFGLVKSLKYLDKMDADENERPESDDDEEDEDDPGSYEIDGEEERPNVMSNGHSERAEKVDEEESEADDEEETETGRQSDGVSDHANGLLPDEQLNLDQEENDGSDEEDGEDGYESDASLIDDTEEEDVGEGEEEVDNDGGHLVVSPTNSLERDVNGEFDGHEEVEDAGRQSDWVGDFVVANGAPSVPLNVDEEENDYSDEEDGEDEYEPDGFFIEDEDAGESEEEVDLGVPQKNELLIIGEIDGHEQDEDDGESWEDEEQGSEGDEVQVVNSIASSNLKRKRDEDDDDGDSVSTSSDNNDADSSSDDVSSDDDE